MNNPFNPSFGKVPPIFIDRDEIVNTLITELPDENSPYQTTLISGVRGVGKTALLADICKKLKEDPRWIVVSIPSNSNILEGLIQALQVSAGSKSRKAAGLIDTFSISAMGLGLNCSVKADNMGQQLLLEQFLQKVKKQKKRVLIAIDEVVSNEAICLFASVYQIMSRDGYPISLLMAGLPGNISELQNHKVLTFLLRSNRINLPMLNHVNIQYSYKNVFSQEGKKIDSEALRTMTALTNGYSYAFQLLGYLLWQKGSDRITMSDVASVLDPYKAGLFRNAYTKIYEELSNVDRRFVQAMAKNNGEPVQMKNISQALQKKPGYLSMYRRRLLDSGVIESAEYGYVRFSLPLFWDYLNEFHETD